MAWPWRRPLSLPLSNTPPSASRFPGHDKCTTPPHTIPFHTILYHPIPSNPELVNGEWVVIVAEWRRQIFQGKAPKRLLVFRDRLGTLLLRVRGRGLSPFSGTEVASGPFVPFRLAPWLSCFPLGLAVAFAA